MSEEKKELTTRQWQLYKYLKLHYEPDKFISKKELADALGYSWNEKSDRNGRDIESDVAALNEDETIQKVIISSSKGYKIANKEEAFDWLHKDWISILKAIKRHMFKRRKCRLNKRMRIVFNSERDTIEAFPDN